MPGGDEGLSSILRLLSPLPGVLSEAVLLNPGGLVPELSYSCVCSLAPYFSVCFDLESALAVQI